MLFCTLRASIAGSHRSRHASRDISLVPSSFSDEAMTDYLHTTETVGVTTDQATKDRMRFPTIPYTSAKIDDGTSKALGSLTRVFLHRIQGGSEQSCCLCCPDLGYFVKISRSSYGGKAGWGQSRMRNDSRSRQHASPGVGHSQFGLTALIPSAIDHGASRRTS